MNLPKEYVNYKLSIVNEGSRHFFSTNIASNWSFENYLERTHSDLNKFKNMKKIKYDYDQDLHWISQLEEVPNVIREYALHLLKKKKPNKAQLKVNLAKRAAKKRKVLNQGVTINGPVNGGIINSGTINTATINNANSTQNHKRTYEGQQEMIEEYDEEESSENNGKDGLEERKPSVGAEWLKFIKKHQSIFHPYSPEANSIIMSGKGISPRPNLDRDLYNKHMENHEVEQYPLPSILCNYLDAAIDSDNLVQIKKEIRNISALLLLNEELKQDENECLEFLEEFLIQVYKTYESPIEYDSNEDAFNQLFIWPYLHLIGKNININNCKGYFVQGQPYLESMSRQLKSTGGFVDEKSQYKTDGLIKLFGLNKLELLLLETSGHFSNNNKTKIKLDHHKGMYGILAMLKRIADDFSFASVDKFSRVKVFFLHAAETKLHLWSVKYQADGLFDLWREGCLEIRPNFEDRVVFLPQLINFCWNTKCLLEQAVNNIADVKKEHQANCSKYRYNPEKYTQLSSVINPVIMKLTKEEDGTGLSNLGPIYSPLHY